MGYVSAYTGLKEPKFDNDSEQIALKYAQEQEICTGHLGYRELPQLIKKYVTQGKALDYGCGAGFSTRMLKNLGFDAVGADISNAMLEQAREQNPDLPFFQVNNERTPFLDHQFDVVLSTFVLFDLPSIASVTQYFQEVRRVLKPSGIFVACTGSEIYHLHNWLTERNDIEANKSLTSGQTYNVHLINYGITFCDFFYMHKDYLEAMKNAGLMLREHLLPLGRKSDGIEWTTEWTKPPYSIYACSSSIE